MERIIWLHLKALKNVVSNKSTVIISFCKINGVDSQHTQHSMDIKNIYIIPKCI